VIAGLSGSLFSHDALERLVCCGSDERIVLPANTHEHLGTWQTVVRDRLGPAASARTVFDLIAEPIARALGFLVVPLPGTSLTVDAILHANGASAAVLIATAWGELDSAVWRHAVHRCLAHGVRWCLCVTGASVRVIDADRLYAKRFADFDLAVALDDERTFVVFWTLMRASTIAASAGSPSLGEIVALCEEHRAEVRLSLRDGVRDALVKLVDAFRSVSRRHADGQVIDESLIVVYRILFLLFAEARALVPNWHPVYQDGYTIDVLRRQLDRAAVPPGVWEALQAIARLAHRGCRAGALRVPPFNGRLFSPADAPLADSAPLDDRAVGEAVMALTTRKGRNGRERISYADLGVEQLGAVYEHLLDYDVAAGARTGPAMLVSSGRRKATGSFYTPRALTEFLVRRTLAPLVQDASADQVLDLRVLDPAMGSGAFLVAACRYLGAAYEQALIREGALTTSDIGEDDRAGFRRAIVQRCLFGVDINPMAVQLGRLSLWLATLSADKPLTFLDHHLRAGNSLVGSSLDAMLRGASTSPGAGPRKRRDLPLFVDDELHASIESAVGARLAIVQTPDDTLQQVRAKERALAAIDRADGPLQRWKSAADVWCAAWYGNRSSAGRAAFDAHVDRILGRASALPAHIADRLVTEAQAVAAVERFFHWPLEFPEVFYDASGTPRAAAGFDAIVGNPPWEMLRNEGGPPRTGELTRFTRGSMIYRLQGQGHANLYPLFVERTLHLLKPAGRAGLVLPSAFSTDQSCSLLRRHVFDRAGVDTFTTIENRDGIFPIHRGLKFLLLTFGNGGGTRDVPCGPAIGSLDALDRIPDIGPATTDPPADRIAVPRSLIEQVSGASLAVPEIRSSMDLEIVTSIAFRVPACGDRHGWAIRFGRELNASDDRPHFSESQAGLPIIEGKHLRAFGIDVSACRFHIPRAAASRLLDADQTFERARLSYREVAAATNRTTLIAAIVPRGVVSTHTVFCLKDPLDDESQQYLCAVFNSYVANYLVRMRVGTHVTAAIIGRLPVPKPTRSDPLFRELAASTRRLMRRYSNAALASLNARVAELYGLSPRQFAHVLDTFPLIAAAERAAALQLFASGKV
jgi:hypothetical protein